MRDVHWEKQVGVFGFINIQLTPIWPVMKESLQGITQYTLERINWVVQRQSISITEKIIGEMIRLPNARITVPPNYKQDEVVEMCIRLAPKDVVVQKEGWKAAQFKGKYTAHMLTLLQAIWLKVNKTTYVTKKLMLLVTMTKEGK